jgi:hypothetical protein
MVVLCSINYFCTAKKDPWDHPIVPVNFGSIIAKFENIQKTKEMLEARCDQLT